MYLEATYGQYSNFGYFVDFNSDINASLAKIETLKDSNWLDSLTKGVVIQWTIYN